MTAGFTIIPFVGGHRPPLQGDSPRKRIALAARFGYSFRLLEFRNRKSWNTKASFPRFPARPFAARQEALDAGLSVLQSENGAICEVFPDGSKRLIKRIQPPIAVTPGKRYQIS